MVDLLSPALIPVYFVIGGVVATLIYRYLPKTVKDKAIAMVVEAEIYLDALEHEVPEDVAPMVTKLKDTINAFYKSMEDGKFTAYELMAIAKEVGELVKMVKGMLGAK